MATSFAYVTENPEQLVAQEVVLNDFLIAPVGENSGNPPEEEDQLDSEEPKAGPLQLDEYNVNNPPHWTVQDFLDKGSMPAVNFPAEFAGVLAGSIAHGKTRAARIQRFKRLLIDFLIRHLRVPGSATLAEQLQVRVARSNFFEYYTSRWPNSYVKANEFRKLAGGVIRQRARRDRLIAELGHAPSKAPKRVKKQAAEAGDSGGVAKASTSREDSDSDSSDDDEPFVKRGPVSGALFDKVKRERNEARRHAVMAEKRAETAEAATSALRDQLEWMRDVFMQQQTNMLETSRNGGAYQFVDMPSPSPSGEHRVVYVEQDPSQDGEHSYVLQQENDMSAPSSTSQDSHQHQQQVHASSSQCSSSSSRPSLIVFPGLQNSHTRQGEYIKVTRVYPRATSVSGPMGAITVHRKG